MKRKLIKQGGSGLTMYLPKKWADKHHLQGGDEINIEEIENRLSITLEEGKKEVKRITIAANTINKSRLRTIISAAYRRGHDEITLTNKEKFSFVEINRIVDSLIGFVITSQDPKKVIITNVMREDIEDVPSIINKLFITVKFMQKEVISYINNKSPFPEIDALKESSLKLRDYCQRKIHVTRFGGDRAYEYNTMVVFLEKYAGNLSQLALLNKKILKDDIAEFLPLLYTALMKKNLEKAITLNQQLGKIKNNIYQDSKQPALVGALVSNLFTLSSRIISVLL
jgi:phosphate uptake regulator